MSDSNATSVDMKDLLVAGSVGAFGGTADWGIFIGREPATPEGPENCVTIYDTPGEAPHPKFLLDYPRFQVRVRSASYLDGYSKSNEIKSILLSLGPQTVNGTPYTGIWIVTDVSFLKSDERGRSILVTSYRAIREPISGANREPL